MIVTNRCIAKIICCVGRQTGDGDRGVGRDVTCEQNVTIARTPFETQISRVSW